MALKILLPFSACILDWCSYFLIPKYHTHLGQHSGAEETVSLRLSHVSLSRVVVMPMPKSSAGNKTSVIGLEIGLGKSLFVP